MKQKGELAPDFDAIDCMGNAIKLSNFRGRRVVLFFFPKAFSLGCTLEVRSFRDHHAEISATNAELIGVSLDKIQRQCAFAKAENLNFTLIGDESKAISLAYGVIWPVLRVDRRATFVINEEGVIDDVFSHEVLVTRHLDDVLERLRAVKT